MAPWGPPKGQKSILMGSLVVLDPNDSPKKISSIFGTGCHKVCTCLLNGASGIAFLQSWRILIEVQDSIDHDVALGTMIPLPVSDNLGLDIVPHLANVGFKGWWQISWYHKAEGEIMDALKTNSTNEWCSPLVWRSSQDANPQEIFTAGKLRPWWTIVTIFTYDSLFL